MLEGLYHMSAEMGMVCHFWAHLRNRLRDISRENYIPQDMLNTKMGQELVQQIGSVSKNCLRSSTATWDPKVMCEIPHLQAEKPFFNIQRVRILFQMVIIFFGWSPSKNRQPKKGEMGADPCFLHRSENAEGITSFHCLLHGFADHLTHGAGSAC